MRRGNETLNMIRKSFEFFFFNTLSEAVFSNEHYAYCSGVDEKITRAKKKINKKWIKQKRIVLDLHRSLWWKNVIVGGNRNDECFEAWRKHTLRLESIPWLLKHIFPPAKVSVSFVDSAAFVTRTGRVEKKHILLSKRIEIHLL